MIDYRMILTFFSFKGNCGEMDFAYLSPSYLEKRET